MATVEKYYTIKHIKKRSETVVTMEIKNLNINYTNVQTKDLYQLTNILTADHI